LFLKKRQTKNPEKKQWYLENLRTKKSFYYLRTTTIQNDLKTKRVRQNRIGDRFAYLVKLSGVQETGFYVIAEMICLLSAKSLSLHNIVCIGELTPPLYGSLLE
jgi:hypothetical protein